MEPGRLPWSGGFRSQRARLTFRAGRDAAENKAGRGQEASRVERLKMEPHISLVLSLSAVFLLLSAIWRKRV